MATVTDVRLIDDTDPDGSITADETVRFALDGKNYVIDLSAQNAKELREQLADWIRFARKDDTTTPAKTKRAAPGRSPARADKEQLRAKREWARKNGYEVSDRGRISQKVVDAFEAAH